MRRSFKYTAVLAAMVAAACSDNAAPTLPQLTPVNTTFAQTLSSDIDFMIIDFFPKGLETATGTRWNNIKNELGAPSGWNGTAWTGPNVTQARKHLGDLTKFVQLKTRDVSGPGICTGLTFTGCETQEHGAGRLILAMAMFVYNGPTAIVPAPTAASDFAYALLSAGSALTLTAPSLRAGLHLDAGSTNEDRIIVVVQNETPVTATGDPVDARCEGPLPTTHCQFPLFYKFESFPHLRLNKHGNFAVCPVIGGDFGATESEHGRMALAHQTPANEADRTPGSTYVDGIEILKLADNQTGAVSCNESGFVPTRNGVLGLGQLALHAAGKFVGRILTPKNAYAYDSGPEHWSDFFSDFNGVDTLPPGGVSIDGVLNDDIWANAQAFEFSATLPGIEQSTPATLFVANDAQNVYLAVQFAQESVNTTLRNSLGFAFDSNNDNEGPGTGDDEIAYFFTNPEGPSNLFTDAYRSAPGTVTNDHVDGAAAFHNDGTHSVYEFSHPLNSGTTGDFVRSAGQTLRIFLDLQVSGARTTWPGAFPNLTYQAYTVCCVVIP